MTKYSLTYAGIITAAISYLFQLFNVQLPYANQEIETALSVVITLGGLIIALVGRYRAGDLTWNGWKLPNSPTKIQPDTRYEIE